MGYGHEQVRELADTINRTPVDLVLVGTPIDLTRLIEMNKPALRVRYELAEQGDLTLEQVLEAVR
jgi:predicted GTPase